MDNELIIQMEHNMVKKKLVGGKLVNIYKRGQGFALGNTENKSSYNPRQNFLARLYNLTVVQFNPQKREFSLLLKVALLLYSILGYMYNRTIMHTNIITVLLNIHLGQGQGEEGKKRAKKQQPSQHFWWWL